MMPTRVSLQNQFGVIRILVIALCVIVLCSCRAITMPSIGVIGVASRESPPDACHSQPVDVAMPMNVSTMTLRPPRHTFARGTYVWCYSKRLHLDNCDSLAHN